ncbi:MAG: AI-2E family transporter [Parcubacteria group bacterium]|nr:AI-2E family transporter [Parcubacteria group bacterium]
MNNENTNLEISWQSAVRVFALAILISAIYFFRDLIALFISAIIIATVVEGPASGLIKRGWPRFLAVATVYFVSILLLAFFIYLLTPVILTEAQGLLETFLTVFNRIFRLGFLTPETIAEVQTNLSDLIQGFGQGAGAALEFLSRFSNAVFSIVVVFITSFYLALQGKSGERIIKLLVPSEHEPYFLGLWGKSQKKISRWFYGQVILSLTVGLAVFLGLWLLGVRYSLLLGILAALLEIVPVVGPVVSGILAVVVAAHQGADLALYTVILFVVVQQVENHVLIPTLMRRFIGLNPVVVVFALLIGGKLAGIWGLILAVPITAALGEVLEDWERKRLLVAD